MTDFKIARLLELAERTTFPAEAEAARAAVAKLMEKTVQAAPLDHGTTQPSRRASAPLKKHGTAALQKRGTTPRRRYGVTLL